MTTISIELVNEFLKNLDEYNLKSKYTRVKNETSDNYHEEKYQGETSTKTEIYKLGVEDLHLKVERSTDSYGESEFVKSLKIVTPIQKTIIDFE